MVQGYYDDALEFIRVERLQIIATMTPPGSVGRHALSTRFTARTRVLSMGYPSGCGGPMCCAMLRLAFNGAAAQRTGVLRWLGGYGILPSLHGVLRCNVLRLLRGVVRRP